GRRRRDSRPAGTRPAARNRRAAAGSGRQGPCGPCYFFSRSSAAAVIASVAVPITASGSGAQKGLWSEGSLPLSAAASHFALGTPPTQKIVLWIDLSAIQ